MLRVKLKYKILLVVFFIMLITSLWPNNIYLLVLFSSLTYIILPFNKWWDNHTMTLSFFSILYVSSMFMHKQVESGFLILSYIVAPVGFYRFAKWIMFYFKNEIIRQKLFFWIILCYLLSLFILTAKDISLVGIINPSRVMVGYSANNSLAATLYGLMASLGIGCISSLFAKRQGWSLRLGYILLSLMSMLVVLHLVNRTGIVVFICCVVSSFIVVSKINITKIFKAVLLISLLGVVIYSTGIVNEDMINAYQQREMDSTYDSKEVGGRVTLWIDAIQNMITHPLGWDRVRYAHNLWLDIAAVGGWGALACFIVLTIKSLKASFRVIRKALTPFSLLLVTTNVALFLSSSVEPVIEGSVLYFSMLVFIWGCIISLSKE